MVSDSVVSSSSRSLRCTSCGASGPSRCSSLSTVVQQHTHSYGRQLFVLSIFSENCASISYIKTRLPLYGRQLFVLSIFIGALVPVTIVELLVAGVGAETAITDVEFLGSVLPGIAAYNFHRLDTEQRVLDGVVSLAVLLFLVVVGIGLTFLVGLSPLAGTLPPLLLAPESDIALAFGLTVDRPPLPVITSNSLSLVLVLAGMAIAELVRFRYQLRVARIIVVPLVVLITFRNGMLLPVWMLATVGAYGSIQLVHWWTLLYGRVLLAFGIIVSILTTVSLVSVVPVIHGVLPFFVGLLGGVTAYNIHVVPQRATGNYRSDRRDARDSRLHCPAARDPTADWPPDGGNRPTAPARRCHRTTGSRCAGQSRTNRAATVSVKSHRTDGPLSGWRGGD